MRELNVSTSTQLKKGSYLGLTIVAILAAATAGFSIALAPFAFNNPLLNTFFEIPSLAALSGIAMSSIVMAVTLFSVLRHQNSFKGGASYMVGLLSIAANLAMGNYLLETLGFYSILIIAALAVASVLGIVYSSRQIKIPVIASDPLRQQTGSTPTEQPDDVIPNEMSALENFFAASTYSSVSAQITTGPEDPFAHFEDESPQRSPSPSNTIPSEKKSDSSLSIPEQLKAFGDIHLQSSPASEAATQLIAAFCNTNSPQEIFRHIGTANTHHHLSNDHVIFLLNSDAWAQNRMLQNNVTLLIFEATLQTYAKSPEKNLSAPAKRIVEEFFFTFNFPAETIASYIKIAQLSPVHITYLLDKTSWKEHEKLKNQVKKIISKETPTTPELKSTRAESKKLLNSSGIEKLLEEFSQTQIMTKNEDPYNDAAHVHRYFLAKTSDAQRSNLIAATQKYEEFSQAELKTKNQSAYTAADRVIKHFLKDNLGAEQIHSNIMSAAVKYNLSENHILLLLNNKCWEGQETLKTQVATLILQSALNDFSRISNKDVKNHQAVFIVSGFFSKLSADTIAQHLCKLKPADQNRLLLPMFWRQNTGLRAGVEEKLQELQPPTKPKRPPFPTFNLIKPEKKEQLWNSLSKILTRSSAPKSQDLVSEEHPNIKDILETNSRIGRLEFLNNTNPEKQKPPEIEETDDDESDNDASPS